VTDAAESVVWINGELRPTSTARVSPFDHGLLVGDGVFETLRAYAGVPFAWTRHYERLCRSAGGLGLAVPPSATLRGAADAVLEANGLSEGRMRVTITGGPAPLGSERGPEGSTVIVAASEARPWPAAVKVVTVPWVRNERSAVAGLKTTSYAENVRALAFAHEREASEAIFANTRGELCEATGSNVFVVRDGTLQTPPAEAGCLLGVTRALVLELCADAGGDAAEVTLAPADLAAADEAFLTSSTREVQPISHVDDAALPSVPGPATTKIAAAFADLLTRDLDP
jgi:branched-chain amino acid aminotransferase